MDPTNDSGTMMNLQAKTFLASIELQQLLSTSLGLLHGAAESCIKHDECRARHEVNEHDAEPEVDVEVDVHVSGDERHKVHLTADDRRVRVEVRRQLQTLDAHLHEPRRAARRHTISMNRVSCDTSAATCTPPITCRNQASASK